MTGNLFFEIVSIFGLVVFWTAVFVVFIYPWAYVSTTLHECAHWWVGRLVGFRPYNVVIGNGPLLWQTWVGSVRIDFYGSPLGGFTRKHIFDLSGLWWRGSFAVLAGPASDVLVLCAAVKLSGLCSASASAPVRSLGMLIGLGGIYELMMLVMGVVPREVRLSNGMKSANDGLLILRYLTGANRKLLEARPEQYARAVRHYDPTFAYEESWYRQADHDQRAAFDEASYVVSPAEHEEKARKYLSLLSSPAMTKGEMALMLDSLASLALVRNDLSFRERAIGWAKAAHELFPEAATLRGTWGSALVEASEYQRGIEVLTPLTAEGNTVSDMEISSCYLAKAYARLGDEAKAWEWLERGRKSGAFQGLSERIEGEMWEGAAV